MISIDRNPSPWKLRQFSLALILISSFLIFYFPHEQDTVRVPASIAATALPGMWLILALGSLGLLFPKTARFPFLALSYLTYPLGLTFSYAVLIAVYFLMIAPTGIAMRIAGRDRLELRNWKHSKSRWHLRKRNSDSHYYFRQ